MFVLFAISVPTQVETLPSGDTDKITKQMHILDSVGAALVEEIDFSSTLIWTVPDGLYTKTTILRKQALNFSNNCLIEIENGKNSLKDLPGLTDFNLSSNRHGYEWQSNVIGKSDNSFFIHF